MLTCDKYSFRDTAAELVSASPAQPSPAPPVSLWRYLTPASWKMLLNVHSPQTATEMVRQHLRSVDLGANNRPPYNVLNVQIYLCRKLLLRIWNFRNLFRIFAIRHFNKSTKPYCWRSVWTNVPMCVGDNFACGQPPCLLSCQMLPAIQHSAQLSTTKGIHTQQKKLVKECGTKMREVFSKPLYCKYFISNLQTYNKTWK